MRVLVFAALLWTFVGSARADEACDPRSEACSCEQSWGCWQLLYTSPGTVLGGKATLTHARGATDAGFVSYYATERHATHDHLSGHFAMFGSLGGGTAGNEGSVGFNLDVGYRGTVTETSGPFLRVGTGGMLLGNRALRLSYFEPFQGRAGYQWLDGARVIEAGMTNGLVPVGRYEPGRDAHRDLRRVKELGGYVVVHLDKVRVSASYLHLFDPDGHTARDDVELGRAQLCDYHAGVTFCADGLFVRGKARVDTREPMTHSLYLGFTVGLSP